MSDTDEKPTKKQREKKKFDYEKNTRTIFVGNLPANYDHREVAKLFKGCGPVESARIRSVVPDKEKLAPKVAMITKRIHPKVDSVNAYVVFEHNNDGEPIKQALALNGKLIDGHHIRVDRAVTPNAKRMTLTSRKKSIFVGNLRFDIRDDDLINHFNRVGSVNYVRVVRDRTTGLGKGFAFVVFNDRASVKKALDLDESDFKGRSMRIKKVDEGQEKKNAEKSEKKNTAPRLDGLEGSNVRPAKKILKKKNKPTDRVVEKNVSFEDDNRKKKVKKGKITKGTTKQLAKLSSKKKVKIIKKMKSKNKT